MLLEIKRTLRNKFYLIFIGVNILCFLLGYIFLIALDHLTTITFQQLFESVYTVYTQFGTLIFSALILMRFYSDYRGKYLFFYKTLNYTGFRYYFSKLGMLLLTTLISTLPVALFICVPFGKLSLLPFVFLKLEAVMFYFIILLSILGFVFNNFIFSFFMSCFLWICGILVSSMNPFMQYFAYYDASTNDHIQMMNLLNGVFTTQSSLLILIKNYTYDIVILGICAIIILIISKRWIQHGI